MFVGYLISRRFVFIGPKLVRASLKSRLTVEIICRLVMLGLTVFVAPTVIKMGADVWEVIERGGPFRTEASVTDVPSGSMWSWVWKDVGLKTEDGLDTHYSLFFHPRFPKQDQRYGVVLLRRSKCVLSLELTNAE